MVANLSKLTRAIEHKSSHRELADEIKAKRPEIERALQTDGVYFVSFRGRKFAVRKAQIGNSGGTSQTKR